MHVIDYDDVNLIDLLCHLKNHRVTYCQCHKIANQEPNANAIVDGIALNPATVVHRAAKVDQAAVLPKREDIRQKRTLGQEKGLIPPEIERRGMQTIS